MTLSSPTPYIPVANRPAVTAFAFNFEGRIKPQQLTRAERAFPCV
jgi:hypothetical protein